MTVTCTSLQFAFSNYSRFKTPPEFPNKSTSIPQHTNMDVSAELGPFAKALWEQTTTNFRCKPETRFWLIN